MAEAGRSARRARRRASRALRNAGPIWVTAGVVVVAGALVLGLLVAASGGDGGSAGAGVGATGSTGGTTSCIDVLTRADAFVDAGQGNGELFVARDPETGDWAVQLSDAEEACGLRVREVIDRLSTPPADVSVGAGASGG